MFYKRSLQRLKTFGSHLMICMQKAIPQYGMQLRLPTISCRATANVIQTPGSELSACRMARTQNLSNTATKSVWGLNRRHIVVNSFCIGKEDNQALRTVSYLTGGYKFCPTSLEQAMAMCEMEPMLSQLERPPIQRPGFSPFHAQARFMKSGSRATPDIVTRHIYPKIKQHPNIKDSFVQV